MENLSCFASLLALVVFFAVPLYCELTLDDENLNYDMMDSQFQDFEPMPMEKSQDVEPPKMSKGKQKLQQEENNKKQVEELKTGKHKKIVVKLLSRDIASDKSVQEKGKGLNSDKNAGEQNDINDGQNVDPNLVKDYEEEDTCIDDSEQTTVKPQTIKAPGKTTKKPLKREIKPWNYNDLKSGSRKRNSLDSIESGSNDLESELQYTQEPPLEKLEEDEEACVEEVPETKKPSSPEPVKREMNPKIKNYLKSLKRTKLQANDTRLPNNCVHNDTTTTTTTVQEIVERALDEEEEEECVDDVAMVKPQTEAKRQKRNKQKGKKGKRIVKKVAEVDMNKDYNI